MTSHPSLTTTLPETVVVSGASSGLGTEVCRLLAEAGVRTIGVDLAPAIPDLASMPDYVHVVADVSQEAAWLPVMDQIRREGTLGLVTSAAILDVGTIVETSRDMLVRTLDVNVIGTALAIKSLLPSMVERGGGSIVAIGSVAATFAEQQLSVYAASKAAVRQLVRTIAMDHARQGIRANVLSPGPMMAGLFKRHMDSAADRDKFLATRAGRQPQGQILDPRQVARAVLFLLSDASGAILGADLMADGGLTTSFDFRTGAEGASIS